MFVETGGNGGAMLEEITGEVHVLDETGGLLLFKLLIQCSFGLAHYSGWI